MLWFERRRRRRSPEPIWDIRSAGPRDEPFLREMLLGAVLWREDEDRPALEDAFRDPIHGQYVEGWGREGDAGFVAVDESGRPIGACWIRRFQADAPGYGFVGEDVPELSICVVPEQRGRGIGGRMIQAVLERAGLDGHPAVSLSVAAGNPAIHLYERHGFVRVGFDGHSYTMRASLN